MQRSEAEGELQAHAEEGLQRTATKVSAEKLLLKS